MLRELSKLTCVKTLHSFLKCFISPQVTVYTLYIVRYIMLTK